MKVNEKLSILALPNNAKRSKDGTVPIHIRLTINMERATLMRLLPNNAFQYRFPGYQTVALPQERHLGKARGVRAGAS